MCFLGLLYKVVPGYSVVVAANRDELRERPGTAPQPLGPGIWGGQDPKAGGTWLGVNAQGRVAAVANLASDRPVNPRARSRGLLCLDALRPAEIALEAFLADQLRTAAYNPFNLLVADARGAAVATYDGLALDVRILGAGVHVIGNRRPNAPDEPKVRRGHLLLLQPRDLPEALCRLQAVCRDHGAQPDGRDAICLHGQRLATLSSTILAVSDAGLSRSLYLYAEGNPCLTEYRDVSGLFRSDGRQEGIASHA